MNGNSTTLLLSAVTLGVTMLGVTLLAMVQEFVVLLHQVG